MAKCYKCCKEISIFSLTKGIYRRWGLNFWRRGSALAISQCPHCNTEIQVSTATSIPATILFCAILFGFLKFVEYSKIEIKNDIIVMFAFLLFGIMYFGIWWKFFAKTREPNY